MSFPHKEGTACFVPKKCSPLPPKCRNLVQIKQGSTLCLTTHCQACHFPAVCTCCCAYCGAVCAYFTSSGGGRCPASSITCVRAWANFASLLGTNKEYATPCAKQRKRTVGWGVHIAGKATVMHRTVWGMQGAGTCDKPRTVHPGRGVRGGLWGGVAIKASFVYTLVPLGAHTGLGFL